MLRNKFLKVAFLCCLCVTVLQVGCKDADAPASTTNSSNEIKSSANPEIENSLRTINKNDLAFKEIWESPELQNILTGFGGPTIQKIQTDEAATKDISSYIITINSDKDIQRDIFLATKKTEDKLFIVPFIRLHNVTSGGENGAYIGKVKWFTADGVKLNEMTINNNKISKFSIKSINSSTARTQECKWICTYEQFNKYYQTAKNRCESDWLCDLACSFNPCAVSYTAYAVRYCASCYTTVNGTQIPKLTKEDAKNLTPNW